MKPDLSVIIGSLNLKNPVMTASGTFGYGLEYADYFDPAMLGGIITKTVTLEPRAGNRMPRIAETPAGMLNSIGLANVGVESFLESKLPELENLKTAVIANIAGNTVEEYCLLLQKIANHPRVDAIEVNVSCPNVEQGGLAFGADASVIEEIMHCMRPETDKPLIVKLTPNVTDIQSIAAAAESAGADALSLINTVLGMGVDIQTRKPLLARITGGLSGPAIKPIALAKVYQAAQAVSIPIIGLGGIMTGEDAVEFLIAGASAVQVGTLNFIQPDGALQVISGIEKYCIDHGIERIQDLVGTLAEA
ncbi:dihydroorotate dehydrogenase [candidate division KSB1 bacterium]|nr:dihydroorotate dehydrogenase [candidate division KSB1 bacterium]